MVGIIVLLVLINVATLGSFWWMRKPHHPPHLGKFFKKELNLTQEQMSNFSELKDAHIEKRKQLHEEMKLYKDGLFDEMLSDNPNQANLDSINTKIGEVQIALDRS